MGFLAGLRTSTTVTRYRAQVALEKMLDTRLVHPDQVPPSAEALTPEWLTAVLCAGLDGAHVTDVRVHGGSDGTTIRRAISVQYDAKGQAANLPTEFFSKSTSSYRSRALLCPLGRPENEVAFYRYFRNQMPIEAPTARYAGYHARSGRSLIMFPNLVATAGATFLDPHHYVTRDMAEDMVRLLAAYQSTFWRHVVFANRPAWLKTAARYQIDSNLSAPFEMCSMAGLERAASVIDPSIRADGARAWAAHMRSIDLLDKGPPTLVHFDMHIGNWYVTDAGRMGLSDWSMKIGAWSSDLAYMLVSALTTEDRRAWEGDLLALYREQLIAGGVPDVPDAAAIWRGYRQQMFHPFFYWVFTIGAGANQPDMQPDAISLINISRMSQAIVDLESFAALDS